MSWTGKVSGVGDKEDSNFTQELVSYALVFTRKISQQNLEKECTKAYDVLNVLRCLFLQMQ